MNQMLLADSGQLAQQRDAFIERLHQSTFGLFDIFAVYIGHRLGFYRSLADGGWLTSGELAARTNTHERYVREWLEQQTMTGVLQVKDESQSALQRRYRLPPAYVEVLVEGESLNFLAPLAQLAVGAVHPIHAVLDAFRTGGGVQFADYGTDLKEGQAGVHRAMFLYQLGQDYLPAIVDVHARLQSDPPARVADIGCGGGWSSIGMAQAYPEIRVDGYDVDEGSIELAWANAREAGVTDRVTFHVWDVGDGLLNGRYDVVTALGSIHDMGNPVGVLKTMRRLAGDDGAAIIMDGRVGDTFTTKGTDREWMLYGFSVFHSLPVSRAEHPSAGTDTVMSTGTLERYAQEAGFQGVEVLPIDNFFFQFYRLYAEY